MSRPIRWLDILLQALTLTLLVVLSGVVLVGVLSRYSGASLIWYDEVASVLLAWITFTGAGLATLRNAHLGFGGLLYGAPQGVRIVLLGIVELIFLTVFLIVIWAGWAILDVFGAETMVSVPFVPRSLVQSVLPIGAGVVILARLLTLPDRLRAVIAGADPEHVEIRREIARASEDAAR